MTNQERFEQFVTNMRTTYNAETEKLRFFDFACNFLRVHARDFMPNGMSASHEGIVYLVNYNEDKSLSVTHARSGNTAKGFVRQLKQMALDVIPDNNPDRCHACRKNHKKYGLEIEFSGIGDGSYRTVFLRKLNGRVSINTQNDDFGIDGGGPLEIRNMNGATIEQVSNVLKERLEKFMSAYDWMKLNFPAVDTNGGLITKGCGVHVHMFHKGIPRDRLLAAHSVVGMLIHSYFLSDWQERLNRGYGHVFNDNMKRIIATESRSPWCHDENSATELRTFGVMTPKVLRFALESQEILLANTYSVSLEAFRAFLQNQRIERGTLANPGNYVKALQWFIDAGVVTLTQVKEMKRWLDENAESVCPGHAKNAFFLSASDFGTLVECRGQVPAPRATRPMSTDRTSLVEALQRELQNRVVPATQGFGGQAPLRSEETGSVWCQRIRVAHAEPNRFHQIAGVQYFRRSLARHFDICESCRSRLDGFRVRTTANSGHNESGLPIPGFGFFPRTNGSNQSAHNEDQENDEVA